MPQKYLPNFYIFPKSVDKSLFFCDIACEYSKNRTERLDMKNAIVTAATASDISDGDLKLQTLTFSRAGLTPGANLESSFS
jgi:hypothetical protein